MGIKIKHKDPTLNEFSTDDVVINVQSGSLFFKSNTKLFKLQGDDQSTTDISDSLIITGLINSRGPKYTVELDGNDDSGPRINMGTSPFNTSTPNDSDLFMSFGAYGSINNLDTKDRDFHLYGTNTTTGFYFDESTGFVGIGTTSPGAKLHVEVDDDTDNNLVEILHLERHCDDINSSATAEGGYIGLYVDDDNYGGELARISWRADNANNFEGDGRIGFWTAKSTSGNQGGMALTEQMTLTRDGYVGIGITDPETRLSVLTNFSIVNSDFKSASTAAGSRLVMGLGATSGDTYSWIQAQDLGATSNNNLFLQRYGGNVGIGSTTADQMLHVYNGSVLVEPITYASSQNDYVIKYGAYDTNNWDSHGLKFKSTSGGSPYTSWRTYTTDDVLTWNSDGSIGIGSGAYWGDSGETLYVQRNTESQTTGFSCVAAFKNPTNANNNQGATAGIKLKLGSTSEHAKWSGIACQSAASYSNTTELTFWPNDTTGGEKAVLTSGGNWNIAGSVNPGSDLKLKKNINNIESSLETIKSLRGVTFDWKDEKKDNGKLQHGFIAQEVEKILPNLITKGNNFKHMNYSGIIPVLVEALKDQQKQIDELKKQING